MPVRRAWAALGRLAVHRPVARELEQDKYLERPSHGNGLLRVQVICVMPCPNLQDSAYSPASQSQVSGAALPELGPR